MSNSEIRQWADIVLECRNTYAVMTINRPAKRNAIDRANRQAMRAALDYAAGRFAAIVLTGAGQTFCAGLDLKERKADIDLGIHTASHEWMEVNVAVRQHPAIFIAAVNGTALGGGSTLINVCDLAIAADTARIGMPELSFGVYPGLAGPAVQLTMTRKRAAWMILTAEQISAATALEWGMLNQVVKPDELLAQAELLAGRIAAYDPLALSAAKLAIDRIPAAITDWRQAFEFGDLVNAGIRQRRGGANPFAGALPKDRES